MQSERCSSTSHLDGVQPHQYFRGKGRVPDQGQKKCHARIRLLPQLNWITLSTKWFKRRHKQIRGE
jgi:hypothetical protein